MYLQSRTRRWLQTLLNANTQLHSAKASVAKFATTTGARVLGEQEHKILAMLALDYIDLTLENQRPQPGSWLEDTLSEVVQARQQFAYGENFVASLDAL